MLKLVMNRFIYLTVLILIFILLDTNRSKAQKMGAFTEVSDIGSPGLGGLTRFDESTQSYTLSGSGLNMWANRDEFHFASVKINGDFILTTFCHFEGHGVNPHRKMGLMVREKREAGSRYADVAVHGDGLTSLQYRTRENDQTLEFKSAKSSPDVIQLERRGDSVIVRCATIGEPLTETGRLAVSFIGPVYAGLFVCSHDPNVIERAIFDNFRIDVPAGPHVDGYKSPSASRLELLDMNTKIRKVIYTTKDHIEAPNWSRDGKFLICNSEGLLYRFPLKTKSPVRINTGDVINNNNDHGLSFDGKVLAISSASMQADGKKGSAIYTVPVGGGVPKRITPQVPSYWHGWSPDGKNLVYCAERNGDYDVWRIPSGGGEEYQLTNSKGLDDGPEYSPDGKFIFFNSVRSGLMKIWSMSQDGSNQKQVSYGPFNDWFAHISPDGKEIAYISYPESVPPNSHPHNEHVFLQVQEIKSGKTTVMAYIYGGQGTMNVPSWSPDGTKVAFISYTYGDPKY